MPEEQCSIQLCADTLTCWLVYVPGLHVQYQILQLRVDESRFTAFLEYSSLWISVAQVLEKRQQMMTILTSLVPRMKRCEVFV